VDSAEKRFWLDRAQIAGIDDESALERIGQIIDRSGDLGWLEGLECGVTRCCELRERTDSERISAISLYFESNALEDLRRLRRSYEELWDWEQPGYEEIIALLRRADRLAEHASVEVARRAQIATNLANALSHVGRTVEAIVYWNKAIQLNPPFPMARGNRGFGLYHYGQRTHDLGHQFLLLRHAYADLKEAVNSSLHPEVKRRFSVLADKIEEFFGVKRLTRDFDLSAHSLGKSDEEIAYRRWALQKYLFLNPLNDLGPNTISTADTLMLPGIVVPLSEGPYYPGFFNQMKQEFVSARYLYFTGISSSEPHFSDRGVKMTNTLDYPSYSLAVEQVKAAFHIAYSLFDKVAYFLNYYLCLGIPENYVTFRTLWYHGEKKERGIREELINLRNIPLQALFWVSKDLYERKPGFEEALEPDAQEVAAIRNYMEHKYLKIHEFGRPMKPGSAAERALADTLAYSVGRDEFERKALRMLVLTRATLIYLTQVVYLEEHRRRGGLRGPIVPMELDSYEDEWKY
jgi:tetratricopeptide (TPR) repeat protein